MVLKQCQASCRWVYDVRRGRNDINLRKYITNERKQIHQLETLKKIMNVVLRKRLHPNKNKSNNNNNRNIINHTIT